ncbi:MULTISPECIES: YidB family protein [unclassified Rhizobium]|uniref:YidB family protein n=2 Tax=Rhizobium TaxID=379 RepID=UPI001AD9EC08|nr:MULTISPECIES: YidB family protein [unclassified Rhizobium]MBO9097572.1 DUF937 domain-containing protein [Rhizobium sp. L58/93]MBO9133023.1 DUF937 domain-containing protein [Rhizobium sp. B209b/85]MBO9168438.1 DUF937 domain-containing protein [Rhizobium sp. L245/93]MBO9183771.1 DUF937 domain-containing protein [Rhizobium sp. E27B/91]QXZ84579.1 DUF937 domain-containing protein [Rhizobium sp. K1/93]
MNLGPMKALLGVLAVAGYQHRDQIAEVLRNLTKSGQAPSPQQPGTQQSEDQAGGLGGLLGSLTQGGLGGLLGGGSAGGILSGGLGGLLEQFQQNGHGDAANSWVSPGDNAPIDNQQLSQALGPDVIKELTEKTGLSEQELLSRLSQDLPKAVNDLTPDGKVPDEKSFAQLLQ